MKDKQNSFKTSLSVPIFESYNKAIYNLLKSKEYENYTDVVLSTLGKELEKYFSTDDFRLKYRYKSIKSYSQNISKDSDVSQDNPLTFESHFNPYINYDIIGMRLVIEDVPSDFEISEKFIMASKQKFLELQKNLYTYQNQFYTVHKPEEQQDLQNQIIYLTHEMNYYKNCTNFKSLMKKREETKNTIALLENKSKNKNSKILQEEIQSAKTLLQNLNNTISMIAGEFAIEHIFENSEELKNLGVYLNPDRQKFFYDKTGYTSTHFCIQSSKLPNWIAELQNRTSLIEYLSKYAPDSTHDRMPNKKRRLLNLPLKSNSRDLGRYLKKLGYISPLYTKYISDGYIKRYSPLENVKHYYKKLLLRNPTYSNELDSIVTKDDNNTFMPHLLSEHNNTIYFERI